MILLLGGTTEAIEIATALADRKLKVLVSNATDYTLDVNADANIELRTGPLDEQQLAELILQKNISAIVDATHPYAEQITAIAQVVAEKQNIKYFRFQRAQTQFDYENTYLAKDHGEAAAKVFSYGCPVLLTIGSRNLACYAAGESGKLFVRVLPVAESLDKCAELGIIDEHVIAAKGPFGIEDNVAVIKKHGIGVIVTKDSGVVGGVPEKIEAAKQQNCKVVVVGRPEVVCENCFYSVDELVDSVMVNS